MKNKIILLLYFISLISCEERKTAQNLEEPEIIIPNEASQESPGIEETYKTSFSNVDEIINLNNYSTWINTEIKDSEPSLRLIFNLYKTSDKTLLIEYSSECYLMFPYDFLKSKIEVKFDTIIDTKYNFGIVQAMTETENKYFGKTFMILELMNDTTLKAQYPFPELIERFNESEPNRVLFPKSFNLIKNNI